jgi:hypothetical protein
MTNKKILHLQIPINPNSDKKDDFMITPDLLGEFMKFLKEKIGNEFVVVASPCSPSLLSRKDSLYNFKLEQMTLEDIKEMIKNGSSSE